MNASLSTGGNDILLCSKLGMSIRFSEKDVRTMGRVAAGVRGMDLDEGDEVVGMTVDKTKKQDILSVTNSGYGKRTETEEYRVQSRGGKGIITMKTTDKNGEVIGARAVSNDDDLMVITDRWLSAYPDQRNLNDGPQYPGLFDWFGSKTAKKLWHARASPRPILKTTPAQMRSRRNRLGIALPFLLLILAGCNARSPETKYHLAERLLEDKKYEAAISEFQDIVDKSPASALGQEAQLKIAQIQHLYLGRSQEAIESYTEYLKRSKDPLKRREVAADYGRPAVPEPGELQ